MCLCTKEDVAAVLLTSKVVVATNLVASAARLQFKRKLSKMKKALTMLKTRSTMQLFHETRVPKKKRLMTKFLKLAMLNN